MDDWLNRAASTNVRRRDIASTTTDNNSENDMGKTLYHGELCKMGTVTVTVKSDVLDSKFKDKPPYVVLTIDGEDRNYNTENDECAEFFADQKGVRMTIQASGRDNDAVIDYIGEGDEEPEKPEQPRRGASKPTQGRGGGSKPARGAPPARTRQGARQRADNAPEANDRAQDTPPAQERAQGQPAGQTTASNKPPPKPEETPEQKLVRSRVHANKVANAWLIAFKAALYARQQVDTQLGIKITDENFQACVATICIQLEKDGFHHLMPTGVMDIRPTEPAKAPDAKADKADKKEKEAANAKA